MSMSDKRLEILDILAYECYAEGENTGEATGRDEKAIERALEQLDELELSREEMNHAINEFFACQCNPYTEVYDLESMDIADAIIKARELKRSGG